MKREQWTRAPWVAEGLVVAGYLLLTILVFYPLSLHPGSYIPIIDSKLFMWCCWWMGRALELGGTPFYTPYIYYPEGVSLYFFTLNPFYGLLSVPFQALFGVVVAYNLSAIIMFTASGYAAYWLGRDVSGSRAAGLVAGIIFAFAPVQIFHFSIGQANLFSVAFIPVSMLCVYRWLTVGGLRWLLGAAIALALNSFIDWQHALYLDFFTGIAALWLLFEQRETWRAALWTLVRRLFWLQLLYLIAVAPVLVPMLQEFTATESIITRGRDDTIDHSADLLAFFLPNPEHPLWDDWSQEQISRMRRPGIMTTVVSLSYIAMLLAAIGAARRWPQARLWLVCGLVLLVLSLGPQLRLAGQVTGLPLPYELLFQSPFVRSSRAPARIVILSVACMAVLAALGVQALLQSDNRFYRRWLTGGLVALLCFELWPVPIAMERLPPTPAFFTDGTLDDAGALLEVPAPGNPGMYYMTVHERPVLYGLISRDMPIGPVVGYLREGVANQSDMYADWRGNWACVLDFTGYTHLVFYRWLGTESEQRSRAQRVADLMQSGELLRSTPEADLYRLPAVAPQQPCLVAGENWSTPRPFGAQQPYYRWMGQQATLGVLQRAPGPVRLQFQAHSFAEPRQLEIYQGDQLVAQVPVGVEPAPVALELDLPAGESWLSLRSVEPALSPADFGYDETAPVSVGFSELSIESLSTGNP